MLIVFIVGILLSLLTGRVDSKSIDEKLFFRTCYLFASKEKDSFKKELKPQNNLALEFNEEDETRF